MATNKELHRALERLDSQASKLEAPEAIEFIDAEIASLGNVEYVPHFEVHKAGVMRAAGRIADAARLLTDTAVTYPEVDSVHFFAGQYFLESGNYALAIEHLSRCIDICEKSGEDWYLESARLLRAYCAAKVGDGESARIDLTSIQDDDPMSWIEANPEVSKTSIESMLDSSANRRINVG